MQRRLAAIIHADLAGFTRMMEGAETRTFRHLKSAQIEVWRPAIAAGWTLAGLAIHTALSRRWNPPWLRIAAVAFDAIMIAIVMVLIALGVRQLLPFLPGRRE